MNTLLLSIGMYNVIAMRCSSQTLSKIAVALLVAESGMVSGVNLLPKPTITNLPAEVLAMLNVISTSGLEIGTGIVNLVTAVETLAGGYEGTAEPGIAAGLKAFEAFTQGSAEFAVNQLLQLLDILNVDAIPPPIVISPTTSLPELLKIIRIFSEQVAKGLEDLVLSVETFSGGVTNNLNDEFKAFGEFMQLSANFTLGQIERVLDIIENSTK